MTVGGKIEGLIIGATGLIGRQIGSVLTDKGIKWQGTYGKRQESGLSKLNITDLKELEKFFSKHLPEVVFHCANLSGGVDFCERNPEIATGFHLNATKDIGNYCQRVEATMVFISSDYVFDGTKSSYKEEDLPNPLNLYGRLKLQAEQWIEQNLKKYIIIRTTNVYGWDPQTVTPNYVMGLYRTIKEGKVFNAPSFLWGNPTYVSDLAEAIVELYMKEADGIFHVVGSSFINRFEWAIEACKILELDCSLINEFKKPSPMCVIRPLRSNLNIEKFTKSYKTVLHDVSSGLNIMKTNMGLN